MWCPSVSLTVWANAWMAGHAAPDDVLDALTAWAPVHSVAAHDGIAAGRAGLPWPGSAEAAGPVSLLQMVRTTAGGRAEHRPDGWPRRPALAVVEPVPGDVRGLVPGTGFAADAVTVGEAVIITAPDGTAVGLVPAYECDGDDEQAPGEPCSLSWSVYALPGAPAVDRLDLGEAEYALRTAVRSSAEALSGLELACSGDADPRALVEDALQEVQHHRLPDHAPARAVRVLSTAAHVQAIITVGAGLAPASARSASEARIADVALQPLAAVVRAARAAAVDAVLQSAWLA